MRYFVSSILYLFMQARKIENINFILQFSIYYKKIGGRNMNKLSKILICIIIVLIISLAVITVKYLKQRDLIYEYMGNYNFSAENLYNSID